MEQIFQLARKPGFGISCDENGLFVGEEPLLERASDLSGHLRWRPRPLVDLNRDLSKCYGLPIEINAKIGGLEAIARALGRGEIAHAQIVALHLRLPDPPSFAKSFENTEELTDLVHGLKNSGLLKADWDPTKHPRWPGKSPGGVGGQFTFTENASATDSPLITAQVPPAIPFPEEWATPLSETLRFPRFSAPSRPSEMAPPPVIGPGVSPRTLPRNPYPKRRKCVEEWAHAEEYCKELKDRGLLKKGGYHGMGKGYEKCLMGQVSEECGGNGLSA